MGHLSRLHVPHVYLKHGLKIIHTKNHCDFFFCRNGNCVITGIITGKDESMSRVCYYLGGSSYSPLEEDGWESGKERSISLMYPVTQIRREWMSKGLLFASFRIRLWLSINAASLEPLSLLHNSLFKTNVWPMNRARKRRCQSAFLTRIQLVNVKHFWSNDLGLSHLMVISREHS